MNVPRTSRLDVPGHGGWPTHSNRKSKSHKDEGAPSFHVVWEGMGGDDAGSAMFERVPGIGLFSEGPWALGGPEAAPMPCFAPQNVA